LGKVVKLEPKLTAAPSRLTPELKGFIDRVLVPILVRGYIEKRREEKSVAEEGENAASCGLMPSAPQAEATR
jgi:hypothetical protein